MKPTREQVITALFNKLVAALVPSPVIDATRWTASAGAALTTNNPVGFLGRRLQTWDQANVKPAVYLGEFGQSYRWQSESLGTILLETLIFIYVDDGSDPSKVPAITMNNIQDLIDAALAPDNVDGKCTLGGLVSSCRINGEVPVAPGDLGGPGVAVLPLNILVANGDLT